MKKIALWAHWSELKSVGEHLFSLSDYKICYTPSDLGILFSTFQGRKMVGVAFYNKRKKIIRIIW